MIDLSGKGVVISHLSGNMCVRSAMKSLKERGLFRQYITGLALFKSSWFYSLFNHGFLKQFYKRLYEDFYKDKTKSYPIILLGRSLINKMGFKCLIRSEKGFFSPQREAIYIDKKTSHYIKKHRDIISGVYCYEDQAYYTFQAANEIGIKCIYDLPTGYWRTKERLLENEKKDNQGWSITLKGLSDSREKLLRKDKELQYADAIVVGSSFIKMSLNDFPGLLPPIKVIPYGFPEVNYSRKYEPIVDRKIKVLFVGTLSQQKGLSYMFESWERFHNKIDLTVVGAGDIDECPIMKEYLSSVNYLGTLFHDEILKIMSSQDVLIFPSLFDGFGLVVTEAMSQGTPCIVSDRSCGPDIITNGYDGWIIEAGSTESISRVLKSIIDNPDLLQEFGERAKKKAAQRPWAMYEKELSEFVESVIH